MRTLAKWCGHALQVFKRSLQLRVVTVAVVLGFAMVTIVGTFLTHSISGEIQDQRVVQLRQQLAQVQQRVITELSDSRATTAESKLQILATVIDPLQNPQISGATYLVAYQIDAAAGAEPPTRAQFQPVASNIPPGVATEKMLSESLLASVANSSAIQWQSTSLANATGDEPALVMGAQIPDQTTGEKYAVFLVYSSSGEASTIAAVQEALIWAGAGLVALLVGIAWLGVRQVVVPVKQAAVVAREVADGDLDQRMLVRGSDEMATLSKSFNDMTLSLVDKIQEMEALSQHQQAFISDVAHELRTPITTIHMAADVIFQQSEDFDPILQRTSKLLVAQVERFESLLADLLEMSRFDAGAAELNVEKVDIHTVVQRVIDMVTPVADRQRSWLRVFPAEEAGLAEIDSSRVERIVRNLVLNACEHGAGHPIDVEVGVNDDAVSVAVRDRGVGLSPEAIQRVFDRFWREDTSRKRTIGGTGLGLSIAAKDAELHQGELAVWGVKNHGAVFRLTLPRIVGATVTESPLPLEQLAEDLSYLLDQDNTTQDETSLVTHAITGQYAPITAAETGVSSGVGSEIFSDAPAAETPEAVGASALRMQQNRLSATSVPARHSETITRPRATARAESEAQRGRGAIAGVLLEGEAPRAPLPSRRQARHRRQSDRSQTNE